MVFEDTRKILNQTKQSKKREAEIEVDIEYLKSSLDNIRAMDYSSEKIGGSAYKDRIGDMISELMELEQKLIEIKCEVVNNRTKSALMFFRIPSPHRDVLRLRYLDDMDFFDIADELGYDISYVYNLHSEAVKMVSEVL